MEPIEPRDARPDTVESRRQIGFLPDYRSWQHAPATFTEHELTIHNHPVMEDWETEYMHRLAKIACMRGGTVLEVGYGMGISARAIQRHPIRAHLIIEANRDVFERLRAFAQSARHPVTPLLGFWQDITPQIAECSLDGILFDTYPLTEREIHRNHFDFFLEAHRMLRPGGVFTYYSDEVSDFSEAHRARLKAAGFTDIEAQVCSVAPPPDCQYWTSSTIVAPVVIKSSRT